MASAGHAQAQSSHPMHFSSPSGHRFSWWRPWKRGAVGFFSNGYCSVTTLRNIVRKVTPNPATGSQNCSFSVGISLLLADGLLRGGLGGERGRDGVAARERVERRLLGLLRLGVQPLLLRPADEEQAEHHHGDRPDGDEEVL